MAKRSRSKKTSSGCPFYKSTALGSFSDLALVNAQLLTDQVLYEICNMVVVVLMVLVCMY